MTNSNLQISHPNYVENRIVRHTSTANKEDDESSLILDVIQRRWKMLFLCFLASIAAGVFCYINYTLPESETEAKMMYRPLPPTDGVGQDRDPIRPLTIAEIFISNENLNALSSQYNLKMSPKKMREYIEVEASRFVNLINIKFSWDDGQEGIDMLNDLMLIVSDRVVAERKNIYAQYIKHQNNRLAENDVQIEEAREQLNQLTQQSQALMAKDGRDASDNGMLKQSIFAAQQKLDDAGMKSSTLMKQISDVRTKITSAEELLRAEALKGKIAQLESRKALYVKHSPKMAALEKEIREFDIKNADLEYTAWKSKLDSLGAMPSNSLLIAFPNPNLATIDKMESELTNFRSKLSDLEIEAGPLTDTIASLSQRVESYQRAFAESVGDVQVTTAQIEEAQRKLEELSDTRADYMKVKMSFKHLEDADFRELDIHTPASWDTTEVFNGKKKLFILAFAGSFFLLAIPVFALEHFFPSSIPAESAAKECDLPIVGRETFVKELQGPQSNHVNSESLRLLALRIQQSVQSPGATVLFSGLNHDESSIPTLTFLAECLARREERVLIIDAWDQNNHVQKNGSRKHKKSNSAAIAANGHSKELPRTANGKPESTKRELVSQEQNPVSLGLSEFFRQTELSPKDLICTTDIPGVDIIPSGSSGFPEEAFGSRRLNDLFDACRGEYTMILVAGPSTNHPSDLHMLSARADGILFTVPNSGRRQSQGEDVVNELRDLGAPIIGIVS